MSNNIYISTSIPYVNAAPHLGHALELIQADVISRFYKLTGNNIYLQTGTDENAFKNVVNAQQNGCTTEKFVADNSELFRELCSKLNIQYNRFIRTTEQAHINGVQKFWKNINSNDLYKKSYSGLYCIGCEDFYTEKDLVNGLCPDHNTKPTLVSEENIFFRLSKYQDILEQIITSGKLKITPEFRKKEILNFIKKGLQDISVTRSSDRIGNWGIKLENDPTQTIYVWIDALINYISGTGYGTSNDWKVYWNNENYKIHVIGKNVWKFHAVYWPALLLSAGFPLPDEIFIHGFVTENGNKISKSTGNGCNPINVINKYGTDTLRYYLLNSVSSYNDGDFSEKLLQEIYKSELANGLGNLINRISVLCEKSKYTHSSNSQPTIPKWYSDTLNKFNFNACIKKLWNIIDEINREINDEKPWILLNNNNNNQQLHKIIRNWINRIQDFLFLLEPFLPETAEKIKVYFDNKEIRNNGILYPKLE